MKKVYKFITTLLVLILLLQLGLVHHVSARSIYLQNLRYQPPEQSVEELYQDVFLSMLSPYVQKEVNNFYSIYLTIMPDVAPHKMYVLSANRLAGYRSFVFIVKVRVDSYLSQDTSVGTDYITFTIEGTGDIRVDDFEHIKSYKLPPDFTQYIRSGYSNPIP